NILDKIIIKIEDRSSTPLLNIVMEFDDGTSASLRMTGGHPHSPGESKLMMITGSGISFDLGNFILHSYKDEFSKQMREKKNLRELLTFFVESHNKNALEERRYLTSMGLRVLNPYLKQRMEITTQKTFGELELTILNGLRQQEPKEQVSYYENGSRRLSSVRYIPCLEKIIISDLGNGESFESKIKIYKTNSCELTRDVQNIAQNIALMCQTHGTKIAISCLRRNILSCREIQDERRFSARYQNNSGGTSFVHYISSSRKIIFSNDSNFLKDGFFEYQIPKTERIDEEKIAQDVANMCQKYGGMRTGEYVKNGVFSENSVRQPGNPATAGQATAGGFVSYLEERRALSQNANPDNPSYVSINLCSIM
ncbi:MAG: hypothetical protein PHY80_03855, partial [Rickettsiales bacterium]|nr:hypothetical protein [Rickettsiales bacterium]